MQSRIVCSLSFLETEVFDVIEIGDAAVCCHNRRSLYCYNSDERDCVFFKFVSSLGGRMDLCRSRLCFFNIAEDFDKHAPRRDAEMGFSTDSPNRQRQIDEERDRDFK